MNQLGEKINIKLKMLLEREVHVNAIKRKFGFTSMQKIFKEIRRRKVEINKLRALEVFGGRGYFHTIDYASQVGSLEVWEFLPECAKYLRFNLPKAEIKITNSYNEIKNITKKYDLIVVDTPICISVSGHYEHFGLFPDIFGITNDFCILILNLLPYFDDEIFKIHPELFDNKHLEIRKSFYKTEDAKNIPIDKMVMTYKQLLDLNGYEIEWFFVEQRNVFCYYLVLAIKKVS